MDPAPYENPIYQQIADRGERLIPGARELIALVTNALEDIRANGLHVSGKYGPFPIDLTIRIQQ